MSWFTLSPEQLAAKARGEASADALDRLADQREGWAEEDDGADDDEQQLAAVEDLREQAEAARKEVAKSGGSLVNLSGIGMVVFRRKP